MNDVSPENFARQLDIAMELGYRFVPARQIAADGGEPMDLAVTFDDAWTSAADHAAPILKQRSIPWTLFVVSDWSDHQSEWTQKDILGWEALKALSAADVELGSHSKSHPDFSCLSEADIEAELRTSREVMHQRLGAAPATFAIPFGQSMNWNETAHELARAAGYEVVYSQAENTRFPGTAPRTFVTKFDNDRIFRALLDGAFDNWEEWV
ncbi:MAG: polysaccharide deacetylase family protein [Hyphomonas sp.]